MSARAARLSASVFTAVLAACGGNDTPTEPDPSAATGSIQVTASTSGADADTEYTVTVGGTSMTLSANGSVTFASVAVGSQTVTLSGVAANCAVTGSSSSSVTVSDGQTASVSFTVTCQAVTNTNNLLAEALDSLEQAMYAALNISDISGLDSFSFAQTHSLFSQALAASPSNDTASFGLAVTTVFMLEDDPDFRAAAEEWDTWIQDGPDPVGPLATLFATPTPLRWRPTTLPLDLSGADMMRLTTSGTAAAELARSPSGVALAPPPSITVHQTLLVDVVAPALEAARDALFAITDPGFVFTVTEGMQGELPQDADPLELDYTDVLALQAGLEVALASIGVATAYVLEPNPASISGFVTAMTPGSTFLTIASGGASRLSYALARLESAASILLDGLDALEAETDDQSDDIIKYDPTGVGDGVTPTDIADARSIVSDVQDGLAGPVDITVDEGGPDEFTFTLDAREFFIDPIQDFKALLPDYEVFTAMEVSESVIVFRWTALNLPDWTFPDPTFSGVLPGMTTGTLVSEFNLDEEFFSSSLVGGYYRLITIDGVDCQDDYVMNQGGCVIGSSVYIDASIGLDGFDGMPHGFLQTESYDPQSGFFSYDGSEGPYTVTDVSGTITVALDLVDQAQQAVMLSATFVDQPGYASIDPYGRARGGSTVTFDHLGATWVFERSW